MTHFMKWVQSYRYCILVAQKYELKYIAASTSLYQPHIHPEQSCSKL